MTYSVDCDLGLSFPNDSQVQQRLRKLGYAPGVVDGKYGSNCIRAVRKFQTNAGLEADGRVDEATWEALFADDAPKNKKK